MAQLAAAILVAISYSVTGTPFLGLGWSNLRYARRAEHPTDGRHVFTREELAGYDGSDPSRPIYLAFNGVVYDVSAARCAAVYVALRACAACSRRPLDPHTRACRGTYGKGGSYNMFAGRDATRSACVAAVAQGGIALTAPGPRSSAGRT